MRKIRKYYIKLPSFDDAVEFVRINNEFSDVNADYRVGRYECDAKSIMGVSTCIQKTAEIRAFSGGENSLNSYEMRISKWLVGVQ